MNKYGQEIKTLDDWADLAFRNGSYEEAEFLGEAIKDWDSEVAELRKDNEEWERRADELAYGMAQIKNLLEDLRTDVQQSAKLNRKEILASLKKAIDDFSEYI